MPEVVIQTKPPTPFPAHPSQLDLADKKRKRDQKGQDVVEEREVVPFKEPKPQKRAKVAKVVQTRSLSESAIVEKGHDRHPKIQTWNPSLVLDRAPLPLDSSIRDFQKGKVGYVSNALEQPLLLPQDMADLRSLKKHEVFLTLKRDLAMVSPSQPLFLFSFFLKRQFRPRILPRSQ